MHGIKLARLLGQPCNFYTWLGGADDLPDDFVICSCNNGPRPPGAVKRH
jgi:hypothetical protein